MVCVGWEDQPFFVKALENNEKSGRYRECHFPQSISVGFIGRTRSYCKGLVARARRAFWWDKSAEDSPWKSILVKFAHLLIVCLSMMSWTFWPKMLSVCSIMRDSKWFLEYSKIFGRHRVLTRSFYIACYYISFSTIPWLSLAVFVVTVRILEHLLDSNYQKSYQTD